MAPKDSENATWPEARLHVFTELRRNAENTHELRDAVAPLLLRVGILEAKVAVYGLVAGVVGTWLANHFLK